MVTSLRRRPRARSVLVTDAVSAAAAAPGRYAFAGMVIDAGADATVRNADGALAGSALQLDRAVQNLVAWGIADLLQAVALASESPSALLGLPARGRVGWDEQGHVLQCVLDDIVVGRELA